MFNILFTTCKVQKIWGFIYTFYGHISSRRWRGFPSTFCQILMSFAFFFATLKSNEKPSLPWHRAGLEIIAREGAEEYSRILPEVLPSGAVVEEEETKGNLGAKVIGLASSIMLHKWNQIPNVGLFVRLLKLMWLSGFYYVLLYIP